MRACVTGCTGFIGQRLVNKLLVRGWDVVCISRGGKLDSEVNVTWLEGDLSQPESLTSIKSLTKPVDVLFHIAAKMPEPDHSSNIYEYMTANVISTVKLLELASELKVKSFVYISSIGVIGKPYRLPITEEHCISPGSPYFFGKICGELACEMSRNLDKMFVTSLRITSPYGEGMPSGSVLPFFTSLALESKEITLYGSGKRAQDFIHVDDIVQACLLAATTKNPGVYNIGSAEPVSMYSLAEKIIGLLPESKSPIIYSNEIDPQESYRWEVDTTKAKDKLKFFPKIDLEEGLSNYISWASKAKQA